MNDYQTATRCYICGKPFEFWVNKMSTMHKVKDHCHLTGNYRGAAHSACNMKTKMPNYIPIFAHNLVGYDLHLFI